MLTRITMIGASTLAAMVISIPAAFAEGAYRSDREWLQHHARLQAIQQELSGLRQQVRVAESLQPVSRLKFDFDALDHDLENIHQKVARYLATPVRQARFLEPIQ